MTANRTQLATSLSIGLAMLFSVVFPANTQVLSSGREAPQEYFILLDTSSSMGPGLLGLGKASRMKRLKESLVRDFLPSVEMGTVLHMYAFDKGIQAERDFTIRTSDDLVKVAGFVNALHAKGQATYAWHSLANVLEKARAKYRKGSTLNLFMYTDGEDNEGKTRLKDVLREYEELRVLLSDDVGMKIFTLGFKFPKRTQGLFAKYGVEVKEVPDDQPIPIPASVSFSWWPRVPVAGRPVLFLNRSTPKANQSFSQWWFGDGTRSSMPEPEHVFENAGKHEVRLMVLGNTVSKSINVRPPETPLKAEFVWRPETPEAGDAVRLKNLSTGADRFLWEVDGRKVSNEREPLLILKEARTYSVSLIAFCSDGRRDRVTHRIQVKQVTKPKVSVKWFPVRPQINEEVLFRLNVQNGAITGADWSFEAAVPSRSTGKETTTRFLKKGRRKINVKVHWKGGTLQLSPQSLDVQALAAPTTNFRIAGQGPWRVGQNVMFIDESTGNVTGWEWDFGDGRGEDKRRHPEYVYDKPGTYTVTLVSSGPGGRSRPASRKIEIAPPPPPIPPDATFSFYPEHPCVGETVIFIYEARGGRATRARWSLADGKTAEGLRPVSVRYGTPGRKRVSLTLQGPGGESTRTKEVNILKPLIHAAFSFAPAKPEAGSVVQFFDRSTGPVEHWRWTIEKNDVVDRYPSHVFRESGRQEIVLHVTGAGGASDEIRRQLIVGLPAPPHAAFSVQPRKNSYNAGETIGFTDRSTGSITQWKWDFGDGRGSSNRDASHCYRVENKAVDFRVALTVSGPGGHDKTVRDLRVQPPFTVRFLTNRTQGELPLWGKPFVVQTSNLSTGENLSFAWDFGDGTPISHEFAPTHEYHKVGTHVIRLSATAQSTGMARRASDVVVRVEKNRQVRKMIVTECTIALALAVCWLAWFLVLRPPYFRKTYVLGTGRFQGKKDLSLGAGWRSATGRHDIPLPPCQEFAPDFATLKESPDIGVPRAEILPSGRVQLSVRKKTDLLRSVRDWLSNRGEGYDNMSVASREVFMVGNRPYRCEVTDEMKVNVSPCWTIEASTNGADSLAVRLPDETRERILSLGMKCPVLSDTRIQMGRHLLRVVFDEKRNRWCLQRESAGRRWGPTICACLSFLLLASPPLWLLCQYLAR